MRTLPHLTTTTNSIRPLVVTKSRKKNLFLCFIITKHSTAKFLQSDIQEFRSPDNPALEKNSPRTECNGNVHPRTDHKGPEMEQRYSSTLSLTSALDSVGWSKLRPVAFTPGEEPVPIVQEAGWAPGPVWTGVKNLAPPPPGFDPCTVQPVESRYTDYTVLLLTR